MVEVDVWQKYRENSKISHLTFKKISGLTDKYVTLRAWRFVTGTAYGFVTLVGGSRDVPVALNSTLTFSDRVDEYMPSIDEEPYLYPTFPEEISAAAVALDSRGAVVTFGGWDGEEDATSACYRRASRYSAWELYHSVSVNFCYAAATCGVDGNIIVCGGGSSIFNGATVFRHVVCLRDDITQTSDDWSTLPDMCQPRCGHGCVTLPSGRSYAVGGYGGGSDYLNSAEYFDAHHMKWITTAPMHHCRSGLGVDMSPGGCIYAVGGSPDGLAGHRTVERFDEREGAWEVVSRMQESRGYLGACFGASGILYAAGGLEDDACTPSIEWMDSRTHRWEFLEKESFPEWDQGNLLLPSMLHRADFQMVWQPS